MVREGARAEELGSRSCRWDAEQHKGAEGEGQGHGDGGRRPFPFITPCAPSVHLAEVSFRLCNTGGGCSGLLVSLLFRALSSLQDRRGLVPRLGGGLRSRAVPSPRDGAEGGAPGSGPRRRALAVPAIAMVAGPNPPVIVFYCTRSDIAARYRRSWVLPSLCVAGFAPFH